MIIGLTGYYQSGKDTVADRLVEKFGFRKVGFSDALYEAIAALFDISVEEAHQYKQDYINVAIRSSASGISDFNQVILGQFTWREMVQRLGTEMGRNVFGRDFWTDLFTKRYLMIPQRLVVRDVRFDNEADLIDSSEGHIWKVIRPGYEGDNHESESGINEAYIQAEIMNNGTIEELHELIDKAMTEVYGFDPQ